MFKDKNTVIGFVLLGLLFFGFFTYTSMQQKKVQARKAEQEAKARDEAKRLKDSTDKVNATRYTHEDTLRMQREDSLANARAKQETGGTFNRFTSGSEKLDSVSNGVMTIVFSSKGGKPKSITLAQYTSFNKKPVQLLGDTADQFGYAIMPGGGKSLQTDDIYFETAGATRNPKGEFTITYQAKDSAGRGMVHTYTVHPNSYLFDCDITLEGADKLVSQNSVSFTRQAMVHQQDNDITFERQSSRVAYLKDGSYGTMNAARNNDKDFSVPVQWVGFAQRFFNSTLFYDAGMKNVKLETIYQPDSAHNLYVARSTANIPVTGATAKLKLQFYTGPNEYNTLNAIGKKMRNLVQLHSQPFGFVKWINRWVLLPVFDFLLKNTGGVGLAIALLTIFIRLLTSPLMYPGYLTGAKMKVLRPDLAKLREKYPDKQEYAMEQMKFMRQAGVNTFAGCLPSLLQIPIFFSLYALFTAHIGIRGEEFWWASDMSKFDEFIKFGFNIPLIGSHLSLFTLLACFTSFLISWYGLSSTPDQDNPILKYLPYIFPVVMIFIFNRLPAALTWYYTVSNIVTLLLQFVIQRYIINHDKILAKIEENRKKVKPKSRFQERYEQMMETQRKVQEMRKKQGGK